MVIEVDLYTAYFTDPINKKSLNVIYMPNLPVVGLNRIPIMHKISCRVQDMQSCIQDVQYYGAVSYINCFK